MPWIIAGGAILGGVLASDAAGSAADTQAGAAAASDATQRYMYDTTRSDNMPFLQAGQAGSNRLSRLLGLSGDASSPDYGSLSRRFSSSDLANDPVYNSGLQFGLNEGTKAINNQAAAGGGLLSGATMKALTRFGNDYGTTKANEAYNRFNTDNTNLYNRLAGISGAGQQASAQVGGAGANMAGNISNTAQGLGNARAASGIAQANALGGGFSSAANAYNQNQLMNRLFPQNSGGGLDSMTRQIYRDAGLS